MTQQNAIVTGGASGIGAGVVKRLSQSGYNVAIFDVQEAPGVVAVDVSDPLECAPAVHEVGDVDILVNSAGVNGANAPLWEYPDGEFERVLAVNLLGTYYMCKAVLPGMLGRRRGRIVNVASIAEKRATPMHPPTPPRRQALLPSPSQSAKRRPRLGSLSTASHPPSSIPR